ncbi:MAG TPA: helix-turn-helix transcriptional regulator [Pseudonocardia sp.]|jgi:transcriptional regulator with XRE-family HTH domain|nr:helix-turn-helix transcriptional regulator [Pseudonocardia sp.]HLU56497.1 helix-turn-helix transcriptional regulator [Pseudonocardia sp.]
MADGQEDEPTDGGFAEARGGPTVLRILVGAQLRRLREASGITREEAAYAIRGSEAKMSRIESGRVGFKPRDVADLLTMYGVTDGSARDLLLSLAEQANEPGWWHRYSDSMPDWFSTYVGLEQAATIIRCYEAQYVPGLLQTEAYANAVINLGEAVRPDEVSKRVELRMHRQQLLYVPKAPDYWAVIDEAVLRRKLGGPDVMREQLDHILEVSRRTNVTVQVVPFERSDVAAVGGPFTLLRFAEPDLPDIVYLEQLNSALYLNKDVDVMNYLQIMNRLAAGALTPERSTELIQSVRDAL